MLDVKDCTCSTPGSDGTRRMLHNCNTCLVCPPVVSRMQRHHSLLQPRQQEHRPRQRLQLTGRLPALPAEHPSCP
jgi:hypothetical protein